ncbi:hypothetical protein D9M71_726090 [compost metagenome]
MAKELMSEARSNVLFSSTFSTDVLREGLPPIPFPTFFHGNLTKATLGSGASKMASAYSGERTRLKN